MEKYLIFSVTEKNKTMLEGHTEIFDEIADQIELMSNNNDKGKYHKDIMRTKSKTNDDLVFNEMINIPLCVIVVSSVFKENDEYYMIVFTRNMSLQKVFSRTKCIVKVKN